MELKTAEFVVNLIEGIGEEAEVRSDYSGRGMYGKETAGIVTSCEGNIVRALAEYIEGGDAQHLNDDEREVFADLALGYRTDSMGRDVIVY